MEKIFKFGTEDIDLLETECVIIPKSELAKLEEVRLALYELLDNQTKDLHFLTRLINITSPMWNIANRKWPEVK